MKWITVMSDKKDPVPSWSRATDADLTRVVLGMAEPGELLRLQSEGKNVPEQFIESQTGRMTEGEWAAFKADLRARGMKDPVLVVVDSKGLKIYEGNHRIRAAEEAGLPVFTELRCFGNIEIEVAA